MSAVEHTGTDLREVLHMGRQRMTAMPSAPQPDWLATVRERGASEVEALPLPDRKQEGWRYTPLSFLTQTRYTPLLDGPFDAVQPSDVEELLLHGHEVPRLVFVNGYFAPALSAGLHRGADGVAIATLGGGLGPVPPSLRDALSQVAEHRHVFAALNSALMADGALIEVSAGAATAPTIEILHVSVGMDEPGISHPRHLVVLGEGARAHLIERYCALGGAVYFNNALVEVVLGTDSELVHERLQEESANAQHLSDLDVRIDARGRYRLVQAGLGGAWSRTDVRVTFAGEGGEATLDGLLLAQDRQLNAMHIDVRHNAPHCTSRETVRSILDGRGRVVFDGRILVAQDAQKTDAVLENHNLMLSRAAEVDTKPQLEIYADDVKCSHGTTVGELDRDMLFYLRSRGVGEAQARQMLCHGFAQAVLERIDSAPLRNRASTLLGERLLGSVPSGGDA